ncbi:hypothetical protein TSUD_348250 [Trifolium subterraneum]|nr:hypothetical protein TSUD_348250 [Trifolium subterraneum]
MVDKTFLFKVDTNVKEETRYEKSYRVKKMTDDVDVIAKFKAKYSVGEYVDGGLEVSIGNSVEVMNDNDLLEKFSDEAVVPEKVTIDLDEIVDGADVLKMDFSVVDSSGGGVTPNLKKVKIEKD